MFDEEKVKQSAFTFFKNNKSKPHIVKKILNGLWYTIFNMIKWNTVTIVTFFVILFSFIEIDEILFSKEREEQQIIWLNEQQAKEKQHLILLNQFNNSLIKIIKSNEYKSITDFEKAIKENNPNINTIFSTKNIIEFNKQTNLGGNEHILFSLDNKNIFHVKNISLAMEQSLQTLETEGKISISENQHKEYGKNLDIEIK